jgi:hypothetical protein
VPPRHSYYDKGVAMLRETKFVVVIVVDLDTRYPTVLPLYVLFSTLWFHLYICLVHLWFYHFYRHHLTAPPLLLLSTMAALSAGSQAPVTTSSENTSRPFMTKQDHPLRHNMVAALSPRCLVSSFHRATEPSSHLILLSGYSLSFRRRRTFLPKTTNSHPAH